MNILILRVSAIGDVVHTLPAIFLLKQLFPGAHISWIVQEKASTLLKDQPFLEKTYVLRDKFWRPDNLLHTWSIIRELRKKQWDAILDFQGLLKTSALLALLKGTSFGFHRKLTRESLTTWFTHHKTALRYTNIVQKNLGLASSLQNIRELHRFLDPRYHTACPTLEVIRQDCCLHIPPEKQHMVDSWLAANALDSFITLTPNTTWESKQWPTRYWNQLLEQLAAARIPYKVVLIGEFFGEQAQSIAQYVVKKSIDVYRPPKWDLLATAHLIKQSRLLIAPDTGLLHLADFLGVATIGVFGPTHAHRHGPFLNEANRKNTVQIPCLHYYQKHHGSETESCMLQFTPTLLCRHIKSALKSNNFTNCSYADRPPLTKEMPVLE